jgi:transposase
VSDCQWLQYLRAVGLLRASFRPEQQICAIRSLMRYRQSSVQMAAVHLQHMQKALDQMNLQLHHVISDLSGTTGMAILAGEHDPLKLVELRDVRIKADEATIAKSLVGDYRREHLFTLRQSMVAYRNYQKQMADIDVEIEQMLAEFSDGAGSDAPALPQPKDTHKPRRNDLRFDLRAHPYRIVGADLTAIPGINAMTVYVLVLIYVVVSEAKSDLGYEYPGTWQQCRAWFGDEQACVDSILAWWKNMGRKAYPKATKLLIMADAGDSNASRLRL